MLTFRALLFPRYNSVSRHTFCLSVLISAHKYNKERKNLQWLKKKSEVEFSEPQDIIKIERNIDLFSTLTHLGAKHKKQHNKIQMHKILPQWSDGWVWQREEPETQTGHGNYKRRGASELRWNKPGNHMSQVKRRPWDDSAHHTRAWAGGRLSERSQALFHSWLRGDTTGAGRLLFSGLSGSSADSYHAILAAVKIYRRPRKRAPGVTSPFPQVAFVWLVYGRHECSSVVCSGLVRDPSHITIVCKDIFFTTIRMKLEDSIMRLTFADF